MGKKKFENMETDELREYLLNQIDEYHKMFKDLKEKHKEVKTLLREAHLLVNNLKQQEE